MRRYSCPTCANEIHFDNTACVNCSGRLGYEPSSDRLLVADAEHMRWHFGNFPFKACINRELIGCNWLIPEASQHVHCRCCQHTQVIPDLSAPENLESWARLERAKRALFYSILKFRLPLSDTPFPADNPLVFEFKADVFTPSGWKEPVVTGHSNGLITINIAEADDLVRERQRQANGEPYRTLMGHFRHEIGHYYWDRLVAGTDQLWNFRTLFGDEGIDYGGALQRHYQFGAPAGWEQSYVSAYASSHPWEDFAETWAHYFHIVDGLETARSYGMNFRMSAEAALQDAQISAYEDPDLKSLIDEWVPLTIAMNATNRSIGNSDFYPFVMSEAIFTKLQFVHALVHPEVSVSA